MSRSCAWVLGGGGLLGSHVQRALQEEAPEVRLWKPGPSEIPWTHPQRAFQALEEQVAAFALAVRTGSRVWTVLWCAGAGVIGSRPEDLEQETAYLARLLALLGEALKDLPGQVLLASSAGGVYGDSPDQPLTETSACSPISAYGKNKLVQERLLLAWAQGQLQVSTLIARISNLYGPGQNLGKPQGLIAHISRSFLHHVPVHIYVPLDTLRDYLFAADCASHFVACLRRLGGGGREDILKVFHGGEPRTIAGVIAAFSRIARGHPRIICASNPARFQQPPRLHFGSKVWSDLAPHRRTDLVVGIHRVHNQHLSMFQRGLLPPSVV